MWSFKCFPDSLAIVCSVWPWSVHEFYLNFGQSGIPLVMPFWWVENSGRNRIGTDGSSIEWGNMGQPAITMQLQTCLWQATK